jgi:hypothetical protein
MKEYYIVSLKHTSKGDTALTFWCANGNGYTWHKDRAGLYSEDIVSQYTSDDNVAVEKGLIDKFWMNAIDYNDKYVSVPNTKQVLFHLGLSDKYMKPKRMAGCRMQFINIPISI